MEDYRLIPLSGKLGKGKAAKVSIEDYERVVAYSWSLNSSGYAQASVLFEDGKRRNYRMHRFIVFGNAVVSPSIEVDHEDNDRLDNRRHKLRVCSRGKNAQNSSRRLGGTSKYKGVFLHSQSGKWASKIQVSGLSYHLGLYTSEVEAAKCYDACARFYFKEFANTNFEGDEKYDEKRAKQNARQSSKKTSRYFGVSLKSGRNYWIVEIRDKSLKRLCQRTFKNELDAALFYDNFVIENNMNKPLNF